MHLSWPHTLVEESCGRNRAAVAAPPSAGRLRKRLSLPNHPRRLESGNIHHACPRFRIALADGLASLPVKPLAASLAQHSVQLQRTSQPSVSRRACLLPRAPPAACRPTFDRDRECTATFTCTPFAIGPSARHRLTALQEHCDCRCDGPYTPTLSSPRNFTAYLAVDQPPSTRPDPRLFPPPCPRKTSPSHPSTPLLRPPPPPARPTPTSPPPPSAVPHIPASLREPPPTFPIPPSRT